MSDCPHNENNTDYCSICLRAEIERLQARVDALEAELEEWKDSCDPGVDTTAVDGYCGKRSSKAGLQAGETEHE